MNIHNLVYVLFAEEKPYDANKTPVVSAGWTDAQELEKQRVNIIRDDGHNGAVSVTADRISVRVHEVNKPAPGRLLINK